MIDDFRGVYRWLSNFERSPVALDGQTFPTVEHAYQAAKNPSTFYRAMILSERQPAGARSRGRRVPLRKDWSEVRVSVMRDLLAQKFALGSYLSTKLIDTGLQELIEGNTWGDTFWGVFNGEGENWLGRLLMERRMLLRLGEAYRSKPAAERRMLLQLSAAYDATLLDRRVSNG